MLSLIYLSGLTRACDSCAFLRFFLRSFAHLVFLTPKPSTFPEPPLHLPFLGVILGGSALSILLHVWSDAPSAGEATGGYLHGGLAMDLVGQKGPTSKWALVLLDLVVMVFQLVQLSAFHTRQNLRATRNSTETTSTPDTTQDLDSEERGVQRTHEAQDIELQDLNPRAFTEQHAATTTGEEGEADTDVLIASNPRADANVLDAFNSGQIIVADLNVFQAIKQELLVSRTTPESAESVRMMRVNLARQLIRWRWGNTMPGRSVG